MKPIRYRRNEFRGLLRNFKTDYLSKILLLNQSWERNNNHSIINKIIIKNRPEQISIHFNICITTTFVVFRVRNGRLWERQNTFQLNINLATLFVILIQFFCMWVSTTWVCFKVYQVHALSFCLNSWKIIYVLATKCALNCKLSFADVGSLNVEFIYCTRVGHKSTYSLALHSLRFLIIVFLIFTCRYYFYLCIPFNFNFPLPDDCSIL